MLWGDTVLRWRTQKWENAPLMCRIFGHKWVGGWYGSHPYFKIKKGPVDNLRTHHTRVYCRCDRCDTLSQVGAFHTTEDDIVHYWKGDPYGNGESRRSAASD